MPQRRRPFALSLAPDGGEGKALSARVAECLVGAIRQGRLRPGEALPGSRALAETLQVSRSTVVAAVQELEAEGWVRSRFARGTFVSDPLPAEPAAVLGPAPLGGPGFELPSLLSPLTEVSPALMNLRQATPDARLAPTEALAKAYPRALRRHGGELLMAGEPKGSLALRRVLAPFLAQRRGLPPDPESLCITHGSQEALDLLADCLLEQGGAVAVEDPGRPLLRAAWERRPGVSLHPVPVDGEGLCVEALEALLAQTPLRLVVVSPLYQLPTGAVMSQVRRERLLELARAHRFAILEIDYDFDYALDGVPPPPLAAVDGLRHTVHLGSLSHLIAPGMHLTFLAATTGLIDRIAKCRARREAQGDRVLEWSVAELIRDEDLARHLRRAGMVYRERRDQAARRLKEVLGARVQVQVPQGGLAFWLGVRGDAGVFAAAARAHGLLLHAGQTFSFREEPLPFLRLPFAELDPLRLEEVLLRLQAAAAGL